MEHPEVSNRISTLRTALNLPGLLWRSVREVPFSLHGLYQPMNPGPFRRLPEEVARNTSELVSRLGTHTAGGRVRFVTDSPYVAIHAETHDPDWDDNMAPCGICGLDLYIRQSGKPLYRGTFRPPMDLKEGYESMLPLPGGLWEVTVNMPLYCGLNSMLIGLKKGSQLAPAEPYAHPVPVVYYGSSITQGGSASHAGNSYQFLISRNLDCDYINLGFSGAAKAEPAIRKYLASLTMSAFVCDYDHNSPDAAHLWETHEVLYRTVRAAHPKTPILLLTRPDVLWNEAETALRRSAIYATYEKAVSEGDRFVEFIDGAVLFEGEDRDACTIDGCHPNDLGMSRMAQVIGMALAKWIS